MKSAQAQPAYTQPAKQPPQEGKGAPRNLTEAERAELRRQLYQFSGRKGPPK